MLRLERVQQKLGWRPAAERGVASNLITDYLHTVEQVNACLTDMRALFCPEVRDHLF